MHTDACISNHARCDWLINGPLKDFVTNYVRRLRNDRYPESTVRAYLGCLAHFSYWLKTQSTELLRIDSILTKRFMHEHLPVCTCPAPNYSAKAKTAAALHHLLKIIPGEQPVADSIINEVERFAEYLTGTCGLAYTTCDRRVSIVGDFLRHALGAQMPDKLSIDISRLDAFFTQRCIHLKPASLKVICNCLRSYFRYRALLGDPTASLAAALPRIADWHHTNLPKVLSDAELEEFLKAFDCADPVGMRDYAIARCLLDLGLRGCEATHLTLESVNWRNGIVTITGTKSKRVQQLPLPVTTGAAIAQYLRQARPQTTNRALFVRHRSPFDDPLSVPAIRNSMNRAFVRCGLRDRFCNTHVLRRTMATHLQRSGASIKEIADLLRHQSLDTAATYARVDHERLRAVALPWPGSQL